MAIKGVLRVVRGSEVKLTLPGPLITIKKDGTLWMSGNPILGITDPEEAKRAAANVRAKKFDRIPADAFTRLGDNPNGLWAGDDEMWAAHPLKATKDVDEAQKAEIARRMVRVYLSSRGWGDFSPVEWVGDITRPDDEILAECRNLLERSHDVDKPNQTNDEILAKITEARQKWETAPARKAAREAEEAADIQRKIENGYCFNCESYCHGDCGHYSNDPRVKYRRDLEEAQREANYGTNEG